MKNSLKLSVLGLATLGAMGLPANVSAAQPNDVDQINVAMTVIPFAEISIVGSNLLYLRIPPPGSTQPSNGVNFVVNGNALATVVAEPAEFIAVPGEGVMGKAVLNGGNVGYDILLRFPHNPVVGSPVRNAGLPLTGPGPTDPPLTVNLPLTGGTRQGQLHLIAHPNWTETGAIPLPGIYAGQVSLTVMADY